MVLYEDKIPDLSIAFKNLRKDLGLTMSGMAKRLDVGLDAIKKWEKNGLPADKVFLVTKKVGYNDINWINQVNRFYGVNLCCYDKGDFDEYEKNSVVFPELITRDPYAPENYILLVLQRAKEGFYTKKNEKREKYINALISEDKIDNMFADKDTLSKYNLSDALTDVVSYQKNLFFSDKKEYLVLINGYIDGIADDEERAVCMEKVYSSLAMNVFSPTELIEEMVNHINKTIHNILSEDNCDHKVLAIYIQLAKRLVYITTNRNDRAIKQYNSDQNLADS